MRANPSGSFRLFQISGITVYLHWMWLLVAYYQIFQRTNVYSSISWNVAEYLGLFGIVLLHEFGHSLATRQVGGTADTILLWPLGGVAYVNAPPRPGAELWSITAGPLVNVVLFVPLTIAVNLPAVRELALTNPDAYLLLRNIAWINGALLVFNILPIYPLDGGQILRSLLWFRFGPVRSLLYASIVGFIGVAGLAVLALYMRSIWMGVIAFYVFSNCKQGFDRARGVTARTELPYRRGFACPSCGVAPRIGKLWVCGECETAFDTFEHDAQCPNCHTQVPLTVCGECGASAPISAWQIAKP